MRRLARSGAKGGVQAKRKDGLLKDSPVGTVEVRVYKASETGSARECMSSVKL